MRLNIEKRLRVVNTFNDYNLQCEKNKFELLRILAADENIIATKLTMRCIIKKWQTYRN